MIFRISDYTDWIVVIGRVIKQEAYFTLALIQGYGVVERLVVAFEMWGSRMMSLKATQMQNHSRKYFCYIQHLDEPPNIDKVKVVGLNPGTVYWMDIFSHIFVVKL